MNNSASNTAAAPWQPGFGFSFSELYTQPGLERLDRVFREQLDPALRERLESARTSGSTLTAKQKSDLIIALAPHAESFISRLFAIETELAAHRASHTSLDVLYAVKRKFVQRAQAAKLTPAELSTVDGGATAAELARRMGEPLTEDSYARNVSRWLESEESHREDLRAAGRYAAWALNTKEGKAKHREGILFKQPHKLDPNHLVPVESVIESGVEQFRLPHDLWRQREGFKLTDPGMDLRHSLDQAHYCIKCHNQGKDSCSTGLREKTGEFKKSPFGVTLAGCPLEEKISEMHTVKEEGYSIGALAIITIDNPMCAGTGHRICNDCMKSCIYQKQEPVDIPQVETRTLKDVLDLPWGFEIYSLLTRWNPLNFSRPYPRAESGYKVLVVGLGPAGFALAHHLMNDGHAVTAVDGLKIEPLDAEISGAAASGSRHPFRPIRDVNELYESLDNRVMAGFGGVAEYGITVRWNKNYLKLMRLLLERRAQFQMFGGTRFGGAVTMDSAFDLGFDHVALCMGAGKPTVVDMKNNLARGVRQASDFLMALQLTGAAKHDSIANLQLRLPVVVIGGGLTAIDTATESMAYYVVQVEKFLDRYEALCAEKGESAVRAAWNAEEQGIAGEFLTHARAIRAEREAAAGEGRQPEFIHLLDEWGGVSIAYRRRLIDSPSYTLNHEEVFKALEEGVHFAENLTPVEVVVDQYGHAAALRVKKASGEIADLPARSILVAAGTQPNTVLAREDGAIELDGKYFKAVDAEGIQAKPEKLAKPTEAHVLMSVRPDGKGASFFGDLHPSFSGNVVKAMGSAKQGYPVVSSLLARQAPSAVTPVALQERMNRELRATVEDVVRLTPTIVEVIVKAPAAARAFQPGQFYRLQNFETLAPRTPDTLLAMEGLALTGASVDRENGLLSTIVLEMGGSSDLCRLLKRGDPVVLMGPTGTPTETPPQETALLVGGGLGNAVLFSIGQALRANGSRVVYLAGYKKVQDRYKVEEIERAADVVVWCCDEEPGFTPTRPQDRTVVSNIVEAMVRYGRGDLGPAAIPLNTVDRIIAIGSDGMMAAVARARHDKLAPYLKREHVGIGSINSPMQCMMKEICAQCLQRHRDPETGKETVVFSCFNQDQNLDRVDFASLRERLTQNSVQEKLTKQWIARCMTELGA
ncbi:MAG: pyridine nucleotide-disulfide oxidoreductase [Acidobacteria bacterium]|nr:pyridine nucleotide-disulfide oxidoreductase [Acidobacteriota bacterium]